MAQLLLDHGANVNARGGKYETALQAAASNGSLETVKLLIRHGADATIEGGTFGSPLKAALGEKRGHQDVEIYPHYHVANYLRRHLAKAHTQAAANWLGSQIRAPPLPSTGRVRHLT
jgi:ankyrin repeat protein